MKRAHVLWFVLLAACGDGGFSIFGGDDDDGSSASAPGGGGGSSTSDESRSASSTPLEDPNAADAGEKDPDGKDPPPTPTSTTTTTPTTPPPPPPPPPPTCAGDEVTRVYNGRTHCLWRGGSSFYNDAVAVCKAHNAASDLIVITDTAAFNAVNAAYPNGAGAWIGLRCTQSKPADCKNKSDFQWRNGQGGGVYDHGWASGYPAQNGRAVTYNFIDQRWREIPAEQDAKASLCDRVL